MERPYYVYILKCSDDTFYIGITNCLSKRLAAHNRGVASKYTRTRLPVRYCYYEQVPNRSSALKREIQMKKLSRKQKESLVAQRGDQIDVDPKKL
ncbi:GIY-YIG nuclease family protein [Risungbinella massiliensis]|uniref:GIY-YIG nuclease family protein n=1 Tax=Risungbinella massiliensis TaxID=1329796 RepID=UPI0005CBF43F|nr:GIY-YIG nuclease family protein [Risungbinella massiliensis]